MSWFICSTGVVMMKWRRLRTRLYQSGWRIVTLHRRLRVWSMLQRKYQLKSVSIQHKHYCFLYKIQWTYGPTQCLTLAHNGWTLIIMRWPLHCFVNLVQHHSSTLNFGDSIELECCCPWQYIMHLYCDLVTIQSEINSREYKLFSGWFLFHDTGMSDTFVGVILLGISLFILCTCLVMMVKLLHSVLRGQIAKVRAILLVTRGWGVKLLHFVLRGQITKVWFILLVTMRWGFKLLYSVLRGQIAKVRVIFPILILPVTHLISYFQCKTSRIEYFYENSEPAVVILATIYIRMIMSYAPTHMYVTPWVNTVSQVRIPHNM